MKVYSDLKYAQFETTTDPAGTTTGRFWWNATDGQAKIADGTNVRAFLRNDANCRIGNHASAVNNIRFHRGASGVLQFVAGSDVTAEGSLSTSLAQISGRTENYTFSGKPAAGNAGRTIWVTDTSQILVDTGSVWSAVGGSGSSGSGIEWYEGERAPVSAIENGGNAYLFAQGERQELITLYRVPSGYSAGTQLFLRTLWHSPDSSGTVRFETETTLIRTGTDLITSTTNQRNSTNSAVTMSGANQNIPQALACDLTSSTGTINGVAVAGGDLLIIKFRRMNTDTATSEARFRGTSEITS